MAMPDDYRSFGQRCCRLWVVLVVEAHHQRLITYPELAQAANVPLPLLHNRTFLNPLNDFCSRQRPPLPSLTAIAVRQRQRTPGHGYVGADAQAVFDHVGWLDAPTPTPEDFAGG